jgi:cell division protein FtsA
MAKESRHVAGIDVGTSKVATVIGKLEENGTLAVTGIGKAEARGMRRGVVANLNEVVECLKASVEEAELMAGVSVDRAYVGVGGCNVRGLNSRGVVAVTNRERIIGKEEIQRVLEGARTVSFPQDQQIFHTFPQEFIVDNQDGISEPMGMTGGRLEANVHIITGPVTVLQNLTTVVNRCGLAVAEPVLNLMADAHAVLTDDEKEIGVCLINIGHGTTGIAVFEKGALWHTRVIPLGGEHFINDLAVGLRTGILDAEILMKKYGCALVSLIEEDDMVEVPSPAGKKSAMVPRSRISEILQGRAEELFQLLYEEIRSVGLERTINAGLVLTGGTASLQGLPEVAEGIFDHQVRVGEPLKIAGLTNLVSAPLFATAVGLAVYGAKKEAVEEPNRRKAGWLGRVFSIFRDTD